MRDAAGALRAAAASSLGGGDCAAGLGRRAARGALAAAVCLAAVDGGE